MATFVRLIGAGARGMEDLGYALRCPNVEAVAVADVYTGRFAAAQKLVPGIQTYQDFRRLLDDKSIDAVLIVTPQHQHCLQFVPLSRRVGTCTRRRPWRSRRRTPGV
jgi:predicted dehydrogenase